MGKLFKKTISGDREIYAGEIRNQFYSRRVKDKHIFKYTDPDTKEEIEGWTIDKDACEQHIFSKCSRLIIRNSESKMMYSTTIQTFMKYAIPLRDRYFLPLKFWNKEKEHLAFKRIEVVEKDE